MQQLNDADRRKIFEIVRMKIGNQIELESITRKGADIRFTVTGGGGDSGLDAVQALQEAGINTRSEFIPGEPADNGVTATEKGDRAEVWIELRDPDGPTFINPDTAGAVAEA